ncbi:hypothetical protein [Actomonas aquatica]|uniref:DUF4340 domain-containing protein n=1 Tax=Actomonas aquatica TaxID=2866162 RepID=A0ABZ1C889_9BACT|nr:hypothetical protein [Opitutus sp. WL0086]WRQ87726.1 hypothetical protein K1X11_023185 [Opitutus sp. WL0086]
MKSARKLSGDAIALAVAALLVVIALATVLWGERAVAQVRRGPAALAGGAGPVEGTRVTLPEGADVVWSRPRHDAGWGFELFTPPVVFYDRATGRFTVSPAENEPAKALDAAERAFGLQLVDTTRLPYRLQLVGYAGEAGNYFGIFQNEETGDGIVAQPGRRFEDLGLELRQLDVRREDTIVPESMPLREIVAVAEVWDETAGRLVRLSSAGWQWADAPVADVRIAATGEVRQVRAGDRIETADARYEIRSVAAEPASVIVGKQHDDGTREEMTLWPDVSVTTDSPPPPDPFAFP